MTNAHYLFLFEMPGRSLYLFILIPLFVVVLFLFAIYYLIKAIKKNRLPGRILKEFLIALAIWVIITIYLIGYPHPFVGSIWVSVIPYSYFFSLINLYWLIPAFEDKNKSIIIYVLELISAVIILSFPFLLISENIHQQNFSFAIFLFGIATVISLGIAWLIYLYKRDQIQELLHLKKELGRTTSNLQFLRSQINPHFLFNALNTLYGMAIRENAVRTGDGIQKLGDMMRFMLQDNQKDKISLGSEISYLKDYIYLQQLRLAESENIDVNVHISEPSHEYFIAPMLLISFVENAFKHGIRLQEKSWISIDLNYNGRCLDFEVCNSLHHQINHDTEKEQTGIGLKNVKERLKLLYPDKHQLTINSNEDEFKIRLTLNL